MKKNDEYVARHGYLILPRQAKLLEIDLGYSLFGFYMALIMESFWYRGNDKFGYVCNTQFNLCQRLNTSQSTVSRNLRKLEKKGYIIRHTKQEQIFLKYFPLFDSKVGPKLRKKDYANLNELYADVHKINAIMQSKYAEMKDDQPQNQGINILNSSKDTVDSLEFRPEEVDDILGMSDDE